MVQNLTAMTLDGIIKAGYCCNLNVQYYWDKIYQRFLIRKKVELNKTNFFRSGLMSEDVLDKLRMPTFDNWQWEDAEMMFLVQQMFVDLGLVETFHIEVYNINSKNID